MWQYFFIFTHTRDNSFQLSEWVVSAYLIANLDMGNACSALVCSNNGHPAQPLGVLCSAKLSDLWQATPTLTLHTTTEKAHLHQASAWIGFCKTRQIIQLNFRVLVNQTMRNASSVLRNKNNSRSSVCLRPSKSLNHRHVARQGYSSEYYVSKCLEEFTTNVAHVHSKSRWT